MLGVRAELISGSAKLIAKQRSDCATCPWGPGGAMSGGVLFGDRSAPQQAAPHGQSWASA